jgi:hypothetical protein
MSSSIFHLPETGKCIKKRNLFLVVLEVGKFKSLALASCGGIHGRKHHMERRGPESTCFYNKATLAIIHPLHENDINP